LRLKQIARIWSFGDFQNKEAEITVRLHKVLLGNKSLDFFACKLADAHLLNGCRHTTPESGEA
jgi:hypothetical protein